MLITDRLGVLRLLYPLQAPLAKWQLSCSEQAPSWMRELLLDVVDTQFSLGNQIAYVNPDGSLHHCENGWSGGLPWYELINAQDRFRYASLTKLLTADAVLAVMVEADHELSMPLLKLLSDLPPAADARLNEISIGQLLRHSAGFDRLRSSDSISVHNKKPWCPYDLDQLVAIRLDFAPGERHAYSNLGYCLLGVVVERLGKRPFREFMEAEYRLAERNIRFIDGPYLDDEVRYDFRNSDFYGENYYRYFDFPALSSSAGLSGSAVALAELLHEITRRQPLNILSTPVGERCETASLTRCYGYGISPYREAGGDLTLFVQGGLLYGAASRAVIDSEGGVVVWLGSGMPRRYEEASASFNRNLYRVLKKYYSPAS